MTRSERRTTWRRATVGAITLCGLAWTPCARAAEPDPVPIVLSLSSTNRTTVIVPFETVVRGHVELQFSDYSSGEVEIYPTDATADVRATSACTLTVTQGKMTLAATDKNPVCAALFAPTSNSLRRYVSRKGSSDFTTLEFETPSTLAKVPPFTGGLPLNLDVVGTPVGDCFVSYQRAWHRVVCPDGRLTANADPTAAAAIKTAPDSTVVAARFLVDGKVTLYQLPLAKAAASRPQVALQEQCVHQFDEEYKQKQLGSGARHVLCVDATDPGKPIFLLRYSRTPASAPAPTESDYVVRAGVPLLVYVFYSGKDAPDISSDGTEGLPPATYVSTGLLKAAGMESDIKIGVTRREFGPQLGPKFTIKVAIKVDDKTTANASHSFNVETRYWSALRVGLGLGWSPWARDLGIRTTPSGAKYVAITDGDGPVAGLFSPELVAGYTLFLCRPMSDLHPHLGVGFTFGLGVLKTGPGGVTALSSARLGLELAYGLDFALGLSFGVNHHDVPKDGYQPGAVLPSSTGSDIATKYGVTPGFGIVLNLTPSFLKLAGLTAGG